MPISKAANIEATVNDTPAPKAKPVVKAVTPAKPVKGSKTVVISGKPVVSTSVPVANAVLTTTPHITDLKFKDLAMNLGGINYWSPFWPFADALKMESRGFMVGTTNTSVGLEKLDAQGYVKDPGTYNAKPYQNGFHPDKAPRGIYVVTWIGDGDVKMNVGAQATDLGHTVSAEGVHRRTYRLLSQYPGITVVNNAANGDYVRDIHIWMPDHTDPTNKSLAPAPGEPAPFWHPQYIAHLQSVASEVGYLRFMDWTDTNSSPLINWSDNRPADYAFATGNTNWRKLNVPGIDNVNTFGGIGVPWEWVIDLSNRLNVDPWINVPHAANDDYVKNLADLFAGRVPGKTGLKAGLKVYVEYSNEIWSSGTEFAQGDYADTQRKLQGIEKPQFNGRRSAEIFNFFDQRFKTAVDSSGNTVDRGNDVVRVAAAFSGQVYYNEKYIEALQERGQQLTGAAFNADIFAGTVYFGNARLIKYLFNETNWLGVDLNNPDDPVFKKVFDDWVQNQTMTLTAFSASTNATTAKKYGLPYLTYEGGPSLYTESTRTYIKDGKIVDATTQGASSTFSLSSYVKQNFPDDDTNTTNADRFTKLIMAMNEHPRMKQVYQAQLQLSKARGLKTYAAFNDVTEWTKYGQWGSLEYLDQPQGYGYGQAVKWQFLKDWAIEENTIREVGDVKGMAPELPANKAIPPVIAGQFYTYDIDAISKGNGSGAEIKWSLIAGYLPNGLTFEKIDDDTARISGTPTEGGIYKVMIRLLDKDNDPAYAVYSLSVPSTPTEPPPPSTTSGFSAVEDTYATQNTAPGSSVATTNQGEKGSIFAGTGFRSGYVKFDLRGVIAENTNPATIDSVFLKLFIRGVEQNKPGNSRQLWLEEVSDNLKVISPATTSDYWTEANMDYQSAPNSGAQIGPQASLPETPNGWIQFDVTDYVKKNLKIQGSTATADSVVSFVIRGRVQNGANAFAGIELYSKEYGTGERAPQLVLNESTTPTPIRGDITPIVPNERTDPVPSATVTFTKPVNGFDISDLTLSRNGALLSLSGVSLSTTDNKTFTVNGLTTATTASGLYQLVLKTTGTGIVESANITNALVSGDTEEWTTQVVATVVNRHIFYNNSRFDGNNPFADTADDAAIDTSKVALRPGQTATLANVTGYSKGINGIIMDVKNLRFSELTSEDIQFAVGNSSTPGSWTPMTTMPDISIRHGIGGNDMDRITLIWPDGTIKKQWLQVTLKATDSTGLAANDVFYFGNAVGDTMDPPATPQPGNPAVVNVNATDLSRVVNNYSGFTLVSLTNVFDVNRDGRVNATDYSVVVNNYSNFSTLQLITI
ncbi:MAG: hypothetical protein H7144_12950 [Burkholderiales bacterium]|nr:hypothetical protein [Phycisphaerae bacterium]